MSENSGVEGGDARPLTGADLVGLEPVLKRVIGARVSDATLVEDLVQDALEKMLSARPRLDTEAIMPYGIVTARNVVAGHYRREARRAAAQPHLLDMGSPETPDETILLREERDAMAVALDRLSETDRSWLLARDVDGQPIAALRNGTSDATMRVRLARARAKLRVEYVLALRRLELPRADCRPALLALAGGDRSRVESVAVGRHLLACTTCASLSEPILERSRGSAVAVPFLAWRWLSRPVRTHPLASTVAATAVAAAAVAGVFVVDHGGAQPPSRPTVAVARPVVSLAAPASSSTTVATPVGGSATAPTASATTTTPATTTPATTTPAVPGSTLTLNGQPLDDAGPLTTWVGEPVTANSATVLSVVTHNGFWVGSDPGHEVWVELVGPLRPLEVTVGSHVSFTQPIVAQPAAYAASVGVDLPHGAAMLTTEGAHLEVPTTAIVIEP